MVSAKEKRTCAKCCIKVGKAAAKLHRILCEAYSNEALSKTAPCEWYKHFKSGRTSTDNNESLGPP
jgi:hypothetical protein